MDVDDRDSKAVVETTSKGMVADWQSGGSNFANLLMGMVSDGNSMAVCKGDVVTQSPLISMVDSFAPAPSLWDHPANSQSMGFNSMNNHISTSAFDKLGLTGWEASNSHSISQFPADSAFIERAARFSCFSTGNIADMVNPFGVSQQPVNGYHQAGMMPQDPHVIFGGNSVRATSSGEPRKIEVNPASLSVDHRPQEGSPENKNGGYNEDAKQAGSGTVNSGGGQEETSLKDTGAQPSSTKGLGTKKRKRGVQHAEQSRQPSDEDVKDDGKPLSKKANGENGKQSSQTSDPPKEEYIHMRARRGQATNSHSLAERVRREKISERMKFLQDLVPGCSKVTGKAVMLDEIINYVQSLQRQVEFLSMKLATVSPRLDFNIESLLAKDQMYGARAGPPMGFSADMPVVYSQLHPSQPTVIQPNLPVIHSQLTNISEGYKEPTPQVHSLWDGELHNVVQMGFNSRTSPDIQDANSSLPPDHTKVEL